VQRGEQLADFAGDLVLVWSRDDGPGGG